MSGAEFLSNKATPCHDTGHSEGAGPPSIPQPGREGKKRREDRIKSEVWLTFEERALLDAWIHASGKTFADFVRMNLQKARYSTFDNLNLLAEYERIRSEMLIFALMVEVKPWPDVALEILERLVVIDRLLRRLTLGEKQR